MQTIHITKNGISHCNSAPGGSSGYNPASCSAVIEVAQNDRVYVTSDLGTPVGTWYASGFTGFLIKKNHLNEKETLRDGRTASYPEWQLLR